MGDLAESSFTGGLLELLPAALLAAGFAEGFAAVGFAVLFAAAFGAVLFTALVFAPCVFFADFAGADLDFALFAAVLLFAADFAGAFAADFAAGLATGFSGFFAAGFAAGFTAAGFTAAGFTAAGLAIFACGAGAGAAFSVPPTSARTSPFRLKPDFAGATFFDWSVFAVFFELTAIPFFREPWIVLVRPYR
jgi:hypothetical protein